MIQIIIGPLSISVSSLKKTYKIVYNKFYYRHKKFCIVHGKLIAYISLGHYSNSIILTNNIVLTN